MSRNLSSLKKLTTEELRVIKKEIDKIINDRMLEASTIKIPNFLIDRSPRTIDLDNFLVKHEDIIDCPPKPWAAKVTSYDTTTKYRWQVDWIPKTKGLEGKTCYNLKSLKSGDVFRIGGLIENKKVSLTFLILGITPRTLKVIQITTEDYITISETYEP